MAVQASATVVKKADDLTIHQSTHPTPPQSYRSINRKNTVGNFCKANVSASSLCSSWGLPWRRPPPRRSRPAAASQTLQYTTSQHTWYLSFIQHNIKAIGMTAFIFLGQRKFLTYFQHNNSKNLYWKLATINNTGWLRSQNKNQLKDDYHPPHIGYVFSSLKVVTNEKQRGLGR